MAAAGDVQARTERGSRVRPFRAVLRRSRDAHVLPRAHRAGGSRADAAHAGAPRAGAGHEGAARVPSAGAGSFEEGDRSRAAVLEPAASRAPGTIAESPSRRE